MIEFDELHKKLVLKLVYYGPALSGKTTNLLCLQNQLQHHGRGELLMLETTEDRTIYFDLLPFFYEAPSGFKIKLKVFTVPGQVRHDATRKVVLQRADGVVFVADSRSNMTVSNSDSFANLEQNLTLVGLDPGRLPLVVQFNKRDMDDIVSEEDIMATWGGSGVQVTLASALQGWGVINTFRKAVELLFESLDSKLLLQERYGVDRAAFIKAIVKT